MSAARRIFYKHWAELRESAKRDGINFERLLSETMRPRLSDLAEAPSAYQLRERYRLEFYEWLANAEIERSSTGHKQVLARIAGGKARGEQLRKTRADLDARILASEARILASGEKPSAVTKRIAAELKLTTDHVRKVRTARAKTRKAVRS